MINFIQTFNLIVPEGTGHRTVNVVSPAQFGCGSETLITSLQVRLLLLRAKRLSHVEVQLGSTVALYISEVWTCTSECHVVVRSHPTFVFLLLSSSPCSWLAWPFHLFVFRKMSLLAAFYPTIIIVYGKSNTCWFAFVLQAKAVKLVRLDKLCKNDAAIRAMFVFLQRCSGVVCFPALSSCSADEAGIYNSVWWVKWDRLLPCSEPRCQLLSEAIGPPVIKWLRPTTHFTPSPIFLLLLWLLKKCPLKWRSFWVDTSGIMFLTEIWMLAVGDKRGIGALHDASEGATLHRGSAEVITLKSNNTNHCQDYN